LIDLIYRYCQMSSDFKAKQLEKLLSYRPFVLNIISKLEAVTAPTNVVCKPLHEVIFIMAMEQIYGLINSALQINFFI